MPKSACWNRANTVNKEYLTTTTVQNTFNKQYIEAILCQKHIRNEVQLYISFIYLFTVHFSGTVAQPLCHLRHYKISQQQQSSTLS